MTDIEVHISLEETTYRVGTLYRQAAGGRESVSFVYHEDWLGNLGRISLEPAYDLNPTPTDLKARILSTNISLDEGTCSVDLALPQAQLFGLPLVSARKIVAEVGRAVVTWREVSKALGQNRREIERMESAFEHADSVLASKLVS